MRPKNVLEWTDDDWQDFRLEKYLELDHHRCKECVDLLERFIRNGDKKSVENTYRLMKEYPKTWTDKDMTPPELLEEYRREYGDDFPHIPVTFHFGGGMSVRNYLRREGFDENEMEIDNWDDHYMSVFEVAFKQVYPDLHFPWMDRL